MENFTRLAQIKACFKTIASACKTEVYSSGCDRAITGFMSEFRMIKPIAELSLAITELFDLALLIAFIIFCLFTYNLKFILN